jgi:4-alpha-glucanotransferase
MGATTDDPAELPPRGLDLVVSTPEAPWPGGRGTLFLEDGSDVALDGPPPPDVPIGYHHFVAEGAGARGDGDDHGRGTTVILSPGRCAAGLDHRAWGITAQLYAARSGRSWGLGDLADLHALVRWTVDRGGEVVGLNPLHAPTPQPDPPDSPYSPSTRRYRDPLYLSVDHVAAAHGVEAHALDGVRATGRELDGAPRIDRAAIWAIKRRALEQIWERVGTDPAVIERVELAQARDPDLTWWATFCALADRHGPSWPTWPADLRRPDAPAVEEYAASDAEAVRFWAWLQVVLADQLRAAGGRAHVVADLAVGFAPDGFDAWQWQDLLAPGVHIGAPPDLLGPSGQDWGLPPFVPWKLRAAGYRPFAATVRAALADARGLRVDHVMGLSRLFWIPPDVGPVDGAYVHSAGTELLDVLALESVRAGGLVVGEDLGTVEEGLRATLAGRGVLSTRLLWFEERPPAQWPAQAMAAITTHDLATVAGVWTGVDRADQAMAGFAAPAGTDDALRHQLRVAAAVDDSAPLDTVVVGAHRRLAESPCVLVTATLDDLAGAEHRPNLPGTIDEHPNWRLPLPGLLEDVLDAPLATAVADVLAEGVAHGVADRMVEGAASD